MKHDVHNVGGSLPGRCFKTGCQLFVGIKWRLIYSRTFSGFVKTTGSKIRNQTPWHIITWLFLLQTFDKFWILVGSNVSECYHSLSSMEKLWKDALLKHAKKCKCSVKWVYFTNHENIALEELIENIFVKETPLDVRDSLYGLRTNGLKLYKIILNTSWRWDIYLLSSQSVSLSSLKW